MSTHTDYQFTYTEIGGETVVEFVVFDGGYEKTIAEDGEVTERFRRTNQLAQEQLTVSGTGHSVQDILDHLNDHMDTMYPALPNKPGKEKTRETPLVAVAKP